MVLGHGVDVEYCWSSTEAEGSLHFFNYCCETILVARSSDDIHSISTRSERHWDGFVLF
jgi:hypothetical protein